MAKGWRAAWVSQAAFRRVAVLEGVREVAAPTVEAEEEVAAEAVAVADRSR